VTHLPNEMRELLIELVEKTGLLRRDLQHQGDLDRYTARVSRIEQKLMALAAQVEPDDPDLAKALKTAWTLPGRSLAFRNVEHQKGDEGTSNPKSQIPKPKK